jgi:plasmid stabilization system protein ParE
MSKAYRIQFIPEARLDIKEIIDWYNDQKPGLGKRFFQSLKSKLAYIQISPFHFQIDYREIRNALLDTFPYQIHYRILDNNKSILVLAITHTSRNPARWRSRDEI